LADAAPAMKAVMLTPMSAALINFLVVMGLPLRTRTKELRQLLALKPLMNGEKRNKSTHDVP